MTTLLQMGALNTFMEKLLTSSKLTISMGANNWPVKTRKFALDVSEIIAKYAMPPWLREILN